jgi:hypothetical protein
MSKKTAHEMFQSEAWALLNGMLPEEFAAREKYTSVLAAQAAIHGMHLLGEKFAPLLGRRETPQVGEIEELVVEGIQWHPAQAKQLLAEWRTEMTALVSFVGRVPVPVGPEHDTPALVERILSCVERDQLSEGEVQLADALLKAVQRGQLICPDSESEMLVLYLEDAGAKCRAALEEQSGGFE